MCMSLRNRAHAGNMWHGLENCHMLALNIPAVGLGGSQALCHRLCVTHCLSQGAFSASRDEMHSTTTKCYWSPH